MTLETRQFAFRAETDGDGRTLSGVVVPYNTSAQIHENGRDFDESIAPGACRSAVEAGGVPILFAHDRSQVPIAVTTSLEERDDGLHMTARLLTHPLADAVREAIAEGAVRGASIGFQVPEGGDKWRGDERTIHTLDLREVSITPFPAYVSTAVGVRSETEHGMTPGQRAAYLRGLQLRDFGAAPDDVPPDAEPEPPSWEEALEALRTVTAFVKAQQDDGGDGGQQPPGA